MSLYVSFVIFLQLFYSHHIKVYQCYICVLFSVIYELLVAAVLGKGIFRVSLLSCNVINSTDWRTFFGWPDCKKIYEKLTKYFIRVRVN